MEFRECLNVKTIYEFVETLAETSTLPGAFRQVPQQVAALMELHTESIRTDHMPRVQI
jgi:hypothetical protein